MYEELREQVCEANVFLDQSGLVKLTWGNVSGVDRAKGVCAIKPSGVPYRQMQARHIVVVDIASGRIVEGDLKPSSDTPTHLALYRAFADIGGITHAHSAHATMFAQAGCEIPCLGTTHADPFNGAIPVTRPLSRAEVEGDYVAATGAAIVEVFRTIRPSEMPAVLVVNHGPFAWGRNAAESVKNAIALETIAEMAMGTLMLNRDVKPIPDYLLAKHFQRKHGPKATYGQG